MSETENPIPNEPPPYKITARSIVTLDFTRPGQPLIQVNMPADMFERFVKDCQAITTAQVVQG